MATGKSTLYTGPTLKSVPGHTSTVPRSPMSKSADRVLNVTDSTLNSPDSCTAWVMRFEMSCWASDREGVTWNDPVWSAGISMVPPAPNVSSAGVVKSTRTG